MIQLQHNASNTIVLELTCNSLLWNNSGITPYYLFEFVNQSSNVDLLFYSTNISTALTSYDEFIIIETGNTSVLNFSAGTVNLFPGDTLDYFVYEMPVNFVFDPTQAISVVDKGMVWLSGYTTFSPIQYVTTGLTTFTCYEPPQN